MADTMAKIKPSSSIETKPYPPKAIAPKIHKHRPMILITLVCKDIVTLVLPFCSTKSPAKIGLGALPMFDKLFLIKRKLFLSTSPSKVRLSHFEPQSSFNAILTSTSNNGETNSTEGKIVFIFICPFVIISVFIIAHLCGNVKKKARRLASFFRWLGCRDSNPGNVRVRV